MVMNDHIDSKAIRNYISFIQMAINLSFLNWWETVKITLNSGIMVL